MAIFTPKTNIVLSLVVAAGCIVAAFFLSGRVALTPANAESTQELLRAYAAKDTDADGLPDWQESLYGSDPANPSSIDSSMTDREAVDAGKATLRFRSEDTSDSFMENVPGIAAGPNTLTDQFAQEFFGQYLTSHGEGAPSEEALVAFVEDAIASLGGPSSPRFGASDIGSAPSGSLDTYIIAAEAALLTPTTQAPENEIFYFSDAVHKDSDAALESLAAISGSYSTLANVFARVPAPSAVRAKQLRTANALAQMSEVVGKMAKFKDDPLLAFVGLGQYEDAAFELAASFADYKSVLDAAGVVYTQGEPGYQFQSVVETSARAKR